MTAKSWINFVFLLVLMRISFLEKNSFAESCFYPVCADDPLGLPYLAKLEFGPFSLVINNR